MYWKLFDSIGGNVYSNHLKYNLLVIGHDLLKEYELQGLDVYIVYIGNGMYELKLYELVWLVLFLYLKKIVLF